MNPIIVTGMVALIILGIYAIQAGIAQQAELGEIQRVALDRAASNVWLKGLIHDDKHILISNNAAHQTSVIQLRLYSVDAPDILVGAWHTDYPIRPYQTLNLTVTVNPPPTSVTSLLGDVSDMPGDYILKGVSSQGSIFPIENKKPLNAAPDGAYGGLGIMRTSDGGTVASSGSRGYSEFHYAERENYCKRMLQGGGWWLHYKMIIYDQPFEVSDALTKMAYPVGSPTLVDWDKEYRSDAHYKPPWDDLPSCFSIEVDNTNGLVPHPDKDNVYYKTPAPITHSFSINYPISESFVAPHDAKIIVRVEAPFTGHAEASYGFSNNYVCNDGVSTDCRCSLEEYDPEGAAISWKNVVTDPVMTASAELRKNGAPLGTIPLLSGGLLETFDYNSELASQVDPNHNRRCEYTVSTDLTNSWDHSSALDGWLEFRVVEGDTITIDGDVTLAYAPKSGHVSAASRTYGEIVVGNIITTTGVLSE